MDHRFIVLILFVLVLFRCVTNVSNCECDMANEEHEHQLNRRYEYDVYLCFRYVDTRTSFAGNLYNALRRKRFKIFMDEDGFKMGDQISRSVLKALEASRISIVVLSENFAASTYCLHELVKMLECRRMNNQPVWPIFYQVDPSDVRHQKGRFGEVVDMLEERFRDYPEKVLQWRAALSEVGNLAGWPFHGNEYEYLFIQMIVDSALQSLPRYHVVLSFSEKDTRYSFTGYLYHALRREGFKTFMKDKGWEDGEQSSQSLVTAIEKSRLSIIVLSQNYAYSSSCLDELVTILDFMKIKNQMVWPIFYKVEPSDIRHQRNSYGKAMSEHENNFGKDSEKVQTWRSALFEVANLKGWHLKFGYEYDLIEKIVETAIKN